MIPKANRTGKRLGAKSESGRVRILLLRPEEIRPARINDSIYKPIAPSAPGIVSLAKSIRDLGLKEPLVITDDNVILSGHRRFAACQQAGLEVIPCRREVPPVRSTDPGFAKLLVAYNEPRVKTPAEQIR